MAVFNWQQSQHTRYNVVSAKSLIVVWPQLALHIGSYCKKADGNLHWAQEGRQGRPLREPENSIEGSESPTSVQDKLQTRAEALVAVGREAGFEEVVLPAEPPASLILQFNSLEVKELLSIKES